MFRSIAIIFALCLATATVQAALYMAPNGQAVYDNSQDISWVADSNLPTTSGYCSVVDNCVYGTMSWLQAQSWIASLNSASYLDVSNWRLPTTDQQDPTCSLGEVIGPGFGFGCNGSEMGHLYDVQGVSASKPDLFTNVHPDLYWSGTENASTPGDAWVFGFGDGYQGTSGEDSGYYAWAVTPGNPFNAILISPAAVLFPSALTALGWIRRMAAA